MDNKKNVIGTTATATATAMATGAALSLGKDVIVMAMTPEGREAISDFYYNYLAPKEGQTLVWK